MVWKEAMHAFGTKRSPLTATLHCQPAILPCQPPFISSTQPLHPTTGDLGAIAKEYDIAVSTSCPALDYIVVDTTSAAQRCVELLRQVGPAQQA